MARIGHRRHAVTLVSAKMGDEGFRYSSSPIKRETRRGWLLTPDHQERWTFLSNHARVLAAIARDPNARLTQVATGCEITERSAQRIVADLEEAGHLRRQRVGRRTQYTVNREGLFRHPAEDGLSIGTLLELLVSQARQDTDASAAQGEESQT